MNLFDTHCHLDVPEFDADRNAIMQKCTRLGITRVLVPAIARATWGALLDLCSSHDMLFPALGLHPVFITQHEPGDVDELRKQIQAVRPVAVGEIGLDFYIDDPDKPAQLALCQAQLEVAQEFDLPVLLHVRKAHEDMLGLLKQTTVKGGIVHAYNGSLQQAERYLSMGFRFGFGGTMTYENAARIHRLARELPLEAIVLETDAPDMVVAQHRGERNSPEYLPLCRDALAKLRGVAADEIAAQTTSNANQVLGLSE
jgi:TatD DNase family protein